MSISFSINNNSAAAGILSNLNNVQNEMNASYAQLSSGSRINSASDDPAGYAISQQMQSQVNGLNQAVQNAQNGVSLIQTASGAMNQVEGILQTMNTLAVEAANGTETDGDRTNLQQEMNSLAQQVTNVSTQTQFNTMTLLDGSHATSANALSFQIGAQQGQTISLTIANIGMSSLFGGNTSVISGTTSIDISSASAASSALAFIQNAITSLSGYQASVGAVQDQLNYTLTNLQNTANNLQSAESTITDTNMAQAYTQFSQQQVLSQVGISMLSQAQQQPSMILKLLQ